MTLETLFAQLLAMAGPNVQKFKSDFEIDLSEIANNPGTPFIHISRKYGTHMAMLKPADTYPAPGEQVPIWFSTGDRNSVLQIPVDTVEYNVGQNLPGDTRHFIYFDGERLKEITAAKALDIVHAYETHLKAQWKRAERQAA